MTELFLGTYIWASFAIAIILFIYPFQLIIGDVAQDKMGRKAGTPILGGPGDFGFRAFRAASNSLENAPFFIFLILMSVFVQASPTWTNVLAAAALASRLIHMVAYYANQPNIRGLSWLFGLLVMLALSVSLIWTMISNGSF